MSSSDPLVILGSAGILVTIIGLISYLRPAKKINTWYGYRTNFSMKSQEIWDYAQPLAGKAIIVSGIILILTGVFLFFFPVPFDITPTIQAVFISLALIIPFAVVDNHLRSKFPK
ncbi:MAG: hypothetical protein DRI71_03510 [Bacteroidetes bacterium]|nr:MAG: hypothetical protein DRI71_03510 [Bacteroidota bacterium]